jgi:hypothetical protein
MQRLGLAAIAAGNADYVYRAMEGLGWLGCSAARVKNHEVGIACLSGLVQVGRASRAANLQCHWSHCALLPIDHAAERVDWIASWAASMEPATDQNMWARALAEARSRLAGTTHKLSFGKDSTGRVTYSFVDSGTPHCISEGTRTINYTDQNELKDLQIW